MTAQQALCQRIRDLTAAKKMKLNKLAELSGIHHSTLDAMLRPNSTIRNTGVTTVQKICQGLGITFSEFWNSPLFDNLDYED